MGADLKKIYNKYIYIFEEEYLVNLKPNIPYKGHLINLTEYNNLKNMTHYDKTQKYIYIRADSSEIMNQKKLTPIKEIKLKTSRYLINMIYNDNEFILISPALWKFIGEGKENDNQLLYAIDKNNKLIITFDDKKLSFKQDKNKKNIINKQNIEYDIIKYSNIKEITDFYNSVNDYYKFEEKFIDKLKQSNNEQEFGCLVEKIWLDKWLKYINYKEIKEKYKKQIEKKEIKNDLIYNLEKNNYFKHSDLSPINIISPETKEELESFLEKDSIVIVESKFCRAFTQKEILNFIRYKTYNNKIEIFFNNESFITKSNDNIITLKPNGNNKHNNDLLYDNDISKNINIFEGQLKISEKLEILITLFVNNIYIKKDGENITNKKIFLLDNKIIEIFSEELKDLRKIFNEDENSKNIIDNIIIKSSNNSQLSINNIIFNLNKERLKILDEKILKSKKNIPLKKDSQKLKVIDKNNI